MAVLGTGLFVGFFVALAAAVAMWWASGKYELHEQSRQILLGLPVPILALGTASLAAGFWVRGPRRRGELPSALFRLAVTNSVLLLVLIAWVMPTLNPTKTYVPQTRWIREQIGSETRIGLVNLEYGDHKQGAFAYYTGVPVDLLETQSDLERFFREHPRSLVLVRKQVAKEFFSGERAEWRARVVREFLAGGYEYLVLRGP